MDQIKRIKHYENILNKGEKIINNLIKDLDEFKQFEDEYKELDKYFISDERKKDVKDDSLGLLPKDLKTGVLAEDYAYDLLAAYEGFQRIFKDIIE